MESGASAWSLTSGTGCFLDALWTLKSMLQTLKSVSQGDTARDTFYAILDSDCDTRHSVIVSRTVRLTSRIVMRTMFVVSGTASQTLGMV